ncbi:MAG: MarR family transcriptional regulator, partial [Polyangiaceae bacterium]|nr:MarR family transcriptional regulator [Polyangiaceae bacterium]
LQKELAQATGLSNGFVSKVVSRLAEASLVERRTEDGRAHPRSPGLLLDAWAQVYRFDQHDVGRFHAVGRTGPAVLEGLAAKLANQDGLEWAATGLAAAWHWTGFADFRLTTIFVSKPVFDAETLDLRPVERGENVWIVVPKDDGVFYRTERVAGVNCANPVQVYLDLLAHPERAKEAAADLRSHKLAWAS